MESDIRTAVATIYAYMDKYNELTGDTASYNEVKAIFDAIPEKYPNAPEGLSKYISGEEKALLENPMDPQSKDIENIMNEAHSAIMTESVSVDDALQDAVKRIGDLF